MGVRKRPTALVLAAVLMFGLVPSTAAEEATTVDDAIAIAIAHVKGNFAAYGLEAVDVADLGVTTAYTSRHNGVTHVNLQQRFEGLPVNGAHGTVNVSEDGNVIFVGENFQEDIDEEDEDASIALGAPAAVAAAAEALNLDVTEDLVVVSRKAGATRETVVSDGGISATPIAARVGWQPTARGLRLAWNVTIDAASEEHLWNATVDAETGALLDVDDWTDHDRIADLEKRLGRSRTAAAPEESTGPLSLTNNPVNDGSSYRVYALPNESPNDGPRDLLNNPADSHASPFGWHDTDGVAGPDFTITRGNNNHAYLDQDDNEAADTGADVSGGAGLDFDFGIDFGEHSQAYREAVVTNLFYGCNAIHDILYGYGFTEAAGNFQANNYGRGGLQGDYVRCEAADGSGTNNANFSTPSEPTPGTGVPRMQMFLWPGNQFGAQNQVQVAGVGDFGAAWARYGPPAPAAGISGQIVLVNDGMATGPVGTTSDGCEPYGSLPPGSIALVDRANTPPPPPNNQPAVCSFLTQTTNAANAGAVAVIIANNTTSNTAPVLSASFTTPPVGIPTVSVTQADGASIKAAVAGGSTAATVRKNPAHPGIRDGDLDNAIIFHEYGHGVSNRLTGGPAVNCLSGNEQAGEGWSDYLALTLTMDTTIDDPDEPRGLVPYVLYQPDRHGNGLRPRPYTRDMTTQPFTYNSIKSGGWLNGTSLALPHGLGHGWASILWDLNWDLVDKHGFNPNVYDAWDAGGNNRALQYVMDGMKFQGCGPGLVVASRAIIAAADELSDGEDTCTVWATFARRGLGFSAVQGTTNRNDNEEAFDTHPDCRAGFLSPPTASYGQLTDVIAGDVRVLRFSAGGYKGLDVLTPTTPNSRQVDCATLKPAKLTASETPKAAPELSAAAGKSKLSVNSSGVFTYQWQTNAAWAGTCREAIVQRDDGVQHRAFFRFVQG